MATFHDRRRRHPPRRRLAGAALEPSVAPQPGSPTFAPLGDQSDDVPMFLLFTVRGWAPYLQGCPLGGGCARLCHRCARMPKQHPLCSAALQHDDHIYQKTYDVLTAVANGRKSLGGCPMVRRPPLWASCCRPGCKHTRPWGCGAVQLLRGTRAAASHNTLTPAVPLLPPTHCQVATMFTIASNVTGAGGSRDGACSALSADARPPCRPRLARVPAPHTPAHACMPIQPLQPSCGPRPPAASHAMRCLAAPHPADCALLLDLHKRGWEIADHTVSHVSVLTLDKAQIEWELATARRKLAECGIPERWAGA